MYRQKVWHKLHELRKARALDIDIEQDFKRRMFWVGTWFILLIAPFQFTITAMFNHQPSSWIAYGITLVVLIGNIQWVCNSRNFTVGLQVFHSVIFGCATVFALQEMSVHSAGFWWIATIPLIALLTDLTLLAIVQVIFVAAYAVAAYYIEAAPNDSPGAEFRTHAAVVLSTAYAGVYLVMSTIWRRKLQRALHFSRVEAQTSAQAKARFLANMSHEIRTPLNGVIGAVELLKAAKLSESQRAQLLSMQDQSARTLLTLINDVLDWSKLEARKVELVHAPFNLCRLVMETNELFAVTAYDKGLELTSSCDPDVPRHLRGDETRIKQIVHNLVANAVKFTAQGTVHIHLAVAKAMPDMPAAPVGATWYRIDVTDTGIGIASTKIPSLFSPFTQADSSVTRNYGGTGLGLAICQELAGLMGGSVAVRSTLGQGTTFSLSLPLEADKSAPAQANTPLRTDTLLVCRSAGLVQHILSLCAELRIDPQVMPRLPSDKMVAQFKYLLIDAPLLAEMVDARRWVERVTAQGIEITVLAPLGNDSVFGNFTSSILYKPVRLSVLSEFLKVSAPDESNWCVDPEDARARVKGMSVLVCEDSPVNQIIVQTMLEELEVNCIIASNGVEGLVARRFNAFDLVLMDMQMPEMDGLEATRQWRALEASESLNQHVPIVALTANAETEHGVTCLRAGMDGYLMKPFTMSALTQALLVQARRQTASA